MSKRKISYKPHRASTQIRRRPLVFFDLEFSGLNFDNEILQMGCVLVDQKNLEIKKEWSVKVRPTNIETADKRSLKMIGYSKEGWENALSLKKALKKFNAIAKGAVLVGYNPYWDFMFIMKSCWHENVKIAFHWQIVDVLSIALSKLYKNKNIESFRLYEVAKALGVSNGASHNALDDARMTYKIFKKLVQHG